MNLQVNSLSYIRFDDLMPNTEHAARFWTVTDGIAYYATDTPVHKTLDKARIPDPVRAIQISGFNNSLNTKNNYSKSIETLLTWERSKGTCLGRCEEHVPRSRYLYIYTYYYIYFSFRCR